MNYLLSYLDIVWCIFILYWTNNYNIICIHTISLYVSHGGYMHILMKYITCSMAVVYIDFGQSVRSTYLWWHQNESRIKWSPENKLKNCICKNYECSWSMKDLYFLLLRRYKTISGPTSVQYDRILTSRVNYIFFGGKHFYNNQK